MKGLKLGYTYAQQNITQSQKELNPIICDNTDKPRRHYVKWNTGTERKTPHVFILKETKKYWHIEGQSRTVVPKGWGRQQEGINGERLVNGL